MKKIALLLVFFLTIFLRFNNLNWDSNFHLHPDERFLTMVGNAMKIPQSITQYLDPQTSTMNPANIGFKFYVYGTFPIVLNKMLAINLLMDDYNNFTILGRFLSALADIFTLILVYKIARIFVKKFKLNESIALWSSFFYAIAVLPIQLSHFFTVDSFLNLFMIASFYFVLRFAMVSRHSGERERHQNRFWTSQNDGVVNIFLSAIFMGLALGCKVTAIYIIPLNLFFLAYALIPKLFDNPVNALKKIGKDGKLTTLLLLVPAYFLVMYFVLRFASPYYFESGNLFDLRVSKTFLENINSLKSFEGADVWFPPALQWIGRTPILFSLANLAIFGLGLPYFILAVIGMIYLATNVRRLTFYVLLVWVAGLFLYQSTAFVQTMRYYIFLYPFFAICAAVGAWYFLLAAEDLFHNIGRLRFFRHYSEKRLKTLRFTLYALLITMLLIWPLAFSSIYTREHSRVTASRWMHENFPDGSFVLSEHWDDSLPMSVPGSTKQFTGEQLPVFDQDTPEKWMKMDELLQKGDYYVLSSNRAWGTVTRVPEKYPRMSKFYKDLFEGNTEYKRVTEFVSYPRLCLFNLRCVVFNDSWSEEAFTVYDHPQVIIFKKN